MHKDKVLWLTWGAQNRFDTYGRHNVYLANGASSYASIDLGGGRYLKVTATISGLQYLFNGRELVERPWWQGGDYWKDVVEWRSSDGTHLKSYAPGNYSGDSMDDMYNIGGTGSRNQLVYGLRNAVDGGEVRFKVTAKATLEDKPVRLSGMVLGDGESLANSENFYVIGSGAWSIVDLKKNTSKGAYNVKYAKEGDRDKLHFLKGNDDNTGAVGFLAFDEKAYNGNEFEVEFDVYLKGGGLTALTLGLLPPVLDGGDAPERYGTAMHMQDPYTPLGGAFKVDETINLNTWNYNVGTLVTGDGNYLGSTAPDGDTEPLFSKEADADELTGTAGPKEEDAWPAELKRFSHKLFYKKGDKITAKIAYHASRAGYISGWIDFNQNGKFDDNERVTVSVIKADKGSVTMTWTVPENRIVRSTYVRLRFGYNESEVKSPVGVATGGEIEDHKIYILGPTVTNPMLKDGARR